MLVPESITTNMRPRGAFRLCMARQCGSNHQIVIAHIEPPGYLAQNVAMGVFKDGWQVI